MNDTKIFFDSMVKHRRHIHENPELSFKEYNTVEYICNNFKTLENFQVERLTETSVVATIKGKKGPGKTIAFRADIDALPVEEQTGLPFKSKVKGLMHACGHDFHTAILMGFAEKLNSVADKFSGTVKLIFQHAEELPPGGARELVAKGVMDGVDYVFGMHVFPFKPTGSISVSTGPISASQDMFDLIIKGKGSHGSTPELSIDPITIGAEVVSNINNIISRNISAFKNAVISFGQFSSGTVHNIIPQTALIQGTIRTTDPETREFIEIRIKQIVEHIVAAYGAEYEIDYLNGYSSVINDDEAVSIAKKAAIKTVGEEMVLDLPTMMGSEDFSAYTNLVKGAFVGLGGGTVEEGFQYMNHHPMFDINEKAMENALKYNMQIVMDVLG